MVVASNPPWQCLEDGASGKRKRECAREVFPAAIKWVGSFLTANNTTTILRFKEITHSLCELWTYINTSTTYPSFTHNKEQLLLIHSSQSHSLSFLFSQCGTRRKTPSPDRSHFGNPEKTKKLYAGRLWKDFQLTNEREEESSRISSVIRKRST